jgi:hypothetical protein
VNRDLEPSDSSESRTFSESVVKLFYLTFTLFSKRLRIMSQRKRHSNRAFEKEHIMYYQGLRSCKYRHPTILFSLPSYTLLSLCCFLPPTSTIVYLHSPSSPFSPRSNGTKPQATTSTSPMSTARPSAIFSSIQFFPLQPKD